MIDDLGNIFNTSSRRPLILPINNGSQEKEGAAIGKAMRRKVRQASISRLNDVSRRPARHAPFDRLMCPLPRSNLKQKLKEKASIRRSAERREGTELVGAGRSRGSPR